MVLRDIFYVHRFSRARFRSASQSCHRMMYVSCYCMLLRRRSTSLSQRHRKKCRIVRQCAYFTIGQKERNFLQEVVTSLSLTF